MKNRHGFADVIVDVPVKVADHAFQYIVPDRYETQIEIGSTVLVPFGGRQLAGYVIGLSGSARRESLSEIIDLIDEPPIFGKKTLELCYWMSAYYLCSLADCLKLMIPPGRISRLKEYYIRTQSKPDVYPQELDEIIGRLKNLIEPMDKKDILKEISQTALNRLLSKGLVNKRYTLLKPRVNEIKITIASLATGAKVLAVRGEKQKLLLAYLTENGDTESKRLLSECIASRATLKSLAEKGLISLTETGRYREPNSRYIDDTETAYELTDDQNSAVAKISRGIDSKKSQIFLLEGVTGSGKTEVYIQAIAKVAGMDRGAIVLTPEIALTPQLTERFRRRFHDKVAVLHSGLSLGERYDEWRRVCNGEAGIVVGARSALFAPVKKLGLIVIDEEHETSYKQNRNPRYNARIAAEKLAELNNAVLVLGSATPSLETKLKSETSLIDIIKLPKRVSGRKLPAISIVDLRDEFKHKNYSIFSRRLRNEMAACLIRGEKMIIFLNRRGYSSFMLCRDCGHVPKCKNCSVSLTYHNHQHVLLCHHCGYSVPSISLCPACGGHNLRLFGVGTQKVENELRELFSDTPIIRMDADTTVGKDSHRRHLMAFANHRSAILLGTQMVAKGLDFPDVSLIGVINADTALNLPDFRAGERTFQLLMQVAGRSGRGEAPGSVIIQTYSPENYAIAAVEKGSFDEFYRQELDFRAELNYPPYSQMINFIISGPLQSNVRARAITLAAFLKSNLSKEVARVYGPGEAPIPKIKNRWRWHVLLTTDQPERVKSLINDNWSKEIIERKETGVIVDVDPAWLL